ncbi:MAG: hypothetical protein ACKVP0_08710 [Pirellulaceae bacterium]
MHPCLIWSAILLFLSHFISLVRSEDSPLVARLVVSDTEICINDSIIYKLVLTNTLVSSIQITDKKNHVQQFLEVKRGLGNDWTVVRTITAADKGATEGTITISGQDSLALYDHCFFTASRNPIFDIAGKYQFRIRVKCLLGEFMTKPIDILVSDRPADESAAIKNNAVVVSKLLSGLDTPRFVKEYKQFQGRLTRGSVKRSLDLMAKYEDFNQTGTLEGKSIEVIDAFHELSKDCDEVRKEQLAARFVRDALREAKWKDLEAILKTFQEDSSFRRGYLGQLREAKGDRIEEDASK